MKKYIIVQLLTALMVTAAMGTAFGTEKISDRVRNALGAAGGDPVVVYVYFNDKGPQAEQLLRDPISLVSERSLQRRKKVLPADRLVDYTDLPVYHAYVNAIASHAVNVRHELRWLNCVSVDVTPQQALTIAGLACVKNIDLVERYTMSNNTEEASGRVTPLNKQQVPLPDVLNYGASATQNSLIKVNKVHNNGIYGQGVVVANFDAGYTNLSHEVFSTLPMKIWKKKDFRNGDTVRLAENSHGQATLSLIGGYMPGALIGPAFASTYVLCRTEVDPTETPVEMDHWAAAAQWADSLGVDVITSSLGYLTFDTPYNGYTYLAMDGKTLPITIAAELAVQKGIVVFNSAGNNGNNPQHNTLGGPADGANVITVGAITSTGGRADYSSVGPTTDVPNRIKPDVMAQGSLNQVAAQTGYSTYGSGTSWACPMAAGVAACMLSANKDLTPYQIKSILRRFASNASAPNNTVGWGTIDAERSVDSARAMDMTPPVIQHTQSFLSTADTRALRVTARIADNGIIRSMKTNEAPRLYYRKSSGGPWSAWSVVSADTITGDMFSFLIPASPAGTSVHYYFAAQDIALPQALMSTLPAGGGGISPPGTTAPAAVFAVTIGPTSVTAIGTGVPARFMLHHNYPNQFNPSTDILYDLPASGFVALQVYDVGGTIVSRLVQQYQEAGSYRVRFDAAHLPSGFYFYRLTSGGRSAQQKMLLVR